jgi:CTP-dependent riboflavin kinase
MKPNYPSAAQLDSERLKEAMSAGIFKGQVAGAGFGHFSKCRPKFYQNILDLSGLSLHQGTINIKIDGEMPRFPMHKTQRVPGIDQIDLDDNQDILVTRCLMEGLPGFWILPVFKGTNLPNPKGHLPRRIIEVSLIEKLPNIAPGRKVSVEILGD